MSILQILGAIQARALDEFFFLQKNRVWFLTVRERARGNRWRIGLVFYWLINGSTSDAYTFQVMKSGAIFEW